MVPILVVYNDEHVLRVVEPLLEVEMFNKTPTRPCIRFEDARGRHELEFANFSARKEAYEALSLMARGLPPVVFI